VDVYKIAASYLIDRFGMTVYKNENIKETSKSYLFDGKRLNKDKLNHITIEIDSARIVRGYVYVLEGDLAAYQILLYEQIKAEVAIYHESLQKMISDLEEWDRKVATKTID
jgi:hypothetical protein